MADEDEKPKRSYIRRAFKESEDAETVDAVKETEDDEGVEVEEIETAPIDVVFGVEPTSDSLKAKIIKKLGLNKTMVYKPWKGLDHWECSNPRCRWTTFNRRLAKHHACE